MTNDTSNNPTRLKLVHSRKPDPISSSAFVSAQVGPQASLFAHPKPGMIVFVQFQHINDVQFVNVITSAQPAYVFDMRLAPRFDFGTLNRRAVFDLFDKFHTTYVDATAPLMSSNEPNVALRRLSDLLKSSRVDLERPIVFLLGNTSSSAASDSEILSMLSAAGKDALEVLVVPA